MSETILAAAPLTDIVGVQAILLAMLAAVLAAVFIVGKSISWLFRKWATGWRRLFPKTSD